MENERKETMRREIAAHLDKKLLPFWRGLRDDEHGGFYGYVDFDLNIDRTAVKGSILNSRILWFFSNAYLVLKRPQLLEDARHAWEFLKSACLDREYGGVYWSVTFDGKPAEDIKHTYNQAFAIYALSSYYDASGEEEAIELAWSIYELIEARCTDEWGYLEAFDRSFVPVSNEKLSENGVMAQKTMNTLLHVMEGYTELYRVSKKTSCPTVRLERLAGSLRWMLAIFANRIYNPDRKRQEVFFDSEWNTLIDLHSYGHDIETSWLADRTLEILGDAAVTAKILPITDALAEEVYRLAYVVNTPDQKNGALSGSLLNECERGVNDTKRVWWVQAEAVLGFLNYYQKHPEKEAYFDAAEAIWRYIRDRLADPRSGAEWFWDLDENGEPSDRKPIVEPWKCPYHNGRMCFEAMKRLA